MNSLESRFRPISQVRVQTNGIKPHTAPSSAMPPPPVPSMPPPPPPSLSSEGAAATAAKSPVKELSYTEKRDLWVERIKLLTDATIARAEHMQLAQEVEKYQRLVRSARYNGISEEDQTRLNDHLSEVTGRLDAKKNDLNKVLPRLIDADFWGTTVNSPPGMDEFRKEVHNIIADLSKNMQKLHEKYEELRTKATVAPESHMEIDPPGWQTQEGPPTKRRRLSSGEATIAMDARDQEHTRLAKENQLLRDRIAALEQQHSTSGTVIEATKAEIQALSAAVQSYITQAPVLTPPPPPAPLQQVPSLEEILSRIHPSLIQSLHDDMEPLLLNTHQTIQTMLQEQLNHVYTTLLSKMTPTMKTVDVVAAWMERVRRGETFVDNPVQSHNAQ
ncbi:hypothetical protein EVJ58_g1615 [Rhodofomes roseus]|uniref:Uncharacterized protein n=1 Tax=Rhodofomes roseus TaxID=34475 RepID=A0A4Y9YYL5_9APHY|nr:hypothetical protein EVJ58_g1615 [Rhodofomes roseus]